METVKTILLFVILAISVTTWYLARKKGEQIAKQQGEDYKFLSGHLANINNRIDKVLLPTKFKTGDMVIVNLKDYNEQDVKFLAKIKDIATWIQWNDGPEYVCEFGKNRFVPGESTTAICNERDISPAIQKEKLNHKKK